MMCIGDSCSACDAARLPLPRHMALAGMKRERPEDFLQQPPRAIPFQPPAGLPMYIPQRDGDADDDDEADGGALARDDEAPADDDEVLSSDSEDEEEEEDEETPVNFLCCQFEKVTRTKNKWKVQLKEGVFHINGGQLLHAHCSGITQQV